MAGREEIAGRALIDGIADGGRDEVFAATIYREELVPLVWMRSVGEYALNALNLQACLLRTHHRLAPLRRYAVVSAPAQGKCTP